VIREVTDRETTVPTSAIENRLTTPPMAATPGLCRTDREHPGAREGPRRHELLPGIAVGRSARGASPLEL
jgi:hypothetical protein